MQGITSSSIHIVKYPTLQYTLRPVLQCKHLPLPDPLNQMALIDDESGNEDGIEETEGMNFESYICVAFI